VLIGGWSVGYLSQVGLYSFIATDALANAVCVLTSLVMKGRRGETCHYFMTKNNGFIFVFLIDNLD